MERETAVRSGPDVLKINQKMQLKSWNMNQTEGKLQRLQEFSSVRRPFFTPRLSFPGVTRPVCPVSPEGDPEMVPRGPDLNVIRRRVRGPILTEVYGKST